MVAITDPGDVLFGSTRQAILALTFLRPDESFYLREIVRRTGRGTGAVQRELKLLTDCGILVRDRQRFFRANAASPVFEPLKQIVIRTIGLGDQVLRALETVADQIAAAFIFGSFSRGQQHEGSDVDILVITRDNQLSPDRVNELLAAPQEQLGREINPVVLTATEWRRKWAQGNAFVQRLLDGDKIFLIGDADELERLAEKRMAQTSPAHAAGNHRSAGAGRARSQKRKSQRTRR
jgi:predicted nucleotidyltransferase